MGQRANLVLVDDSGYTLYYCHWCANTLEEDLFWGPEFAIPFVSKQRLVGDNGWLDDIWAEGGAIIDRTRHSLLLYGGEDLLYDIPLRRLYLELLQEVWQGWSVRWAYNGILDIANYVQLPHERVLSKKENRTQDVSLPPPREKARTKSVGSIVFEDSTLRLFPLTGSARWYLGAGPVLVEVARNSSGLDYVPLDEWQAAFPQSGFHIDLVEKQLIFWAANETGIAEHVIPAWPNWQVRWLNDGYEAQLERTREKLILPMRSIDEMLTALGAILVRESHHHHGTSALEVANLLKMEGHNIKINPNALRDDPQEVPYTTKREIFDRTVAAWRKRGSIPNNGIGGSR